MEENLHEDKMDDFVRRSLNDHEELPPADMWSRVEEELSEEERKPVFWFWAGSFRRVAAALLVMALVGTVIAEYWYYEEKLKALKSVPAPASSVVENNEIKSKETPVNTVSEHATEHKSAENQALKTEFVNKKGQVNAPAPFVKKRESRPLISRENVPDAAISGASNTRLEVSKPATNEPIIQEAAVVQPILSLETLHTSPRPISLPSAPEIALESANVSVAVTPRPIRPVKVTGAWYATVHAGSVSPIEKTRNPVSRPGRAAFANHRESGHSTQVGMGVGRRFENGFLLESGLTYQNMVRNASHLPRFRFGEGIQIGSPMDRRRLYQYDLETYGGTAEVDLSMERSSSVPQPSDDEPVRLKISVEERLQWLRMPLLLGYQFGQKRWQGSVKTGILANYMLKNEVTITSSVSQNAVFQPVTNTLRFKPNALTWGYYLSTNVGYRLNRNLSLTLEHALTVDFPGKNQYGNKLPEHYLLGLNFGVAYYF